MKRRILKFLVFKGEEKEVLGMGVLNSTYM